MHKPIQRFKRLISKLRITDVTLASAILCSAIFGFGYWFGQANLDSNNNNSNRAEHLKILIPGFGGLLTTGLFVFFINNYVKGKIEKTQNDSNSLCNDKLVEKIRENQILEFLYVLEKAEIPTAKINLSGFSNSIVQLRVEGAEQKIKEKIEKYNEHINACEEAIEGLSKGLINKQNGEF